MENDFFSRSASVGAGEKSGALDLAKRVRYYVHKCYTHFIYFVTFFLIFDYCERRKKFVFHPRELKY